MFMLQGLGDACKIRVSYDTMALSDLTADDSEYFDSIADFERWLAWRMEAAQEIVAVTIRTTVILEDVLIGYYRLDGIPGATMQYDGTVLIVSVTKPTTLGDAFNKALQVTTPVYDPDDKADADAIVAEGRTADDEPDGQGLR